MIMLTGDIHGDYDYPYFVKKIQKLKNSISENDFLIQLGDWGGIWHNKGTNGYKKDKRLQLKWSKKKFTTLIVPGNHENYDMINELPEKVYLGGVVKYLKVNNPYNPTKKYKDIYILKRGEIYTIDGKTFLSMGGAMSQDKNARIQGEDWWPQELWSSEEEKNCLDNLDKVGWKVDYVIAHTCPTSIGGVLAQQLMIEGFYSKAQDPTSKFFDFLIKEGLEFKHWYFGHWHINSTINNYTCTYRDVIKLQDK